jgi:hypothetical protein
MQEREKVRQLSKGDIEKTISLAKEICSIKEVLRLCVQCPYCGTGFSRVSGCNSMVCGNCGHLFCYGCGVVGCHGCSKARCVFLIISFLGFEVLFVKYAPRYLFSWYQFWNLNYCRNAPGKVKQVDVSPFLRAQVDAIKETRKEVTTVRSRQYPCPSCRQPNSKVNLTWLFLDQRHFTRLYWKLIESHRSFCWGLQLTTKFRQT